MNFAEIPDKMNMAAHQAPAESSRANIGPGYSGRLLPPESSEPLNHRKSPSLSYGNYSPLYRVGISLSAR